MSAQHTPGPWALDEDSNIMAHDGAVAVAVVMLADDYPCLDHDEDEAVEKVQVECEANARLMAAAPDMLTALVAMDRALDAIHDFMPLPFEHHRAWIAARAVIAKATGQDGAA